MRLDQRACMMQERRAIGGQSHCARRALDQPFSQHRFQPLQFHADGRLGGAERLGGAGGGGAGTGRQQPPSSLLFLCKPVDVS
jgi:hypothetical protein